MRKRRQQGWAEDKLTGSVGITETPAALMVSLWSWGGPN